MKNWNDCEKLLRQNKAPNQLIKHLYLVSSVAKEKVHCGSFSVGSGGNTAGEQVEAERSDAQSSG